MISKNEKIIISATNFILEKLNMDTDLTILVTNQKFKSINNTGYYDMNNYHIRYNLEWLENASIKSIMITAFHEVYHAYQHKCIIDYEHGISNDTFSAGELKQLLYEFKDLETKYTKDQYQERLLMEVQAIGFSESMYYKYTDEIINIEQFINDYYY